MDILWLSCSLSLIHIYAGLDIAQGEYVFFFDADDLLEPEALSTMYDTISEKHSDLLIGKYDIFNRHTTIEIHNLDDLIELEEIDKYRCV